MNQHLSLGVIGHVDHGKTSLVKALSGIDTDRLKEEKDRGMSIVLGFAHLTLDTGVIDLIDVPGHENFVRTMVAGATGIEAALLVVDAKEGVKPQTMEHLIITELIGVQRGVIAVTKCDLVAKEERAALLTRLHKLLKGTYLESAPTVFTSAVTGEGLDELKYVLQGLCKQRSIVNTGRFYLPVDRSFNVAGRGTVVTGTLRMGSLQVGAEVELMPGGIRTTVRQLECHNQAVDTAWPGQRIGVNLRHVGPQEIGRGKALASIGLMQASTLLDVQLTLAQTLDGALRDGQTVRLLFGTTDVAAQLRLLSDSQITPGAALIAQLRTGQPVAAVAGEPFIIRRESPPMTIGGGRVLDPVAKRHRRSDPEVLSRLQVLAHGSVEAALAERLKAAGYGGMALDVLASLLSVPTDQARVHLNTGIAVMVDETHVVYKPFLDTLADMVLAELNKFHRDHPTKVGAPLSRCRASLPRSASESVVKLVMQRLCAGKRIEMLDGKVRRFGYDPFLALSEPDRQTVIAIESKVRQGALMPPDLEELVQGGEHHLELLYLLVERGNLLLLPGEQPGRKLVFHCESILDADQRMRRAFPPPAMFTVSELREMLGSTRKFTVPLLQYFDSVGYTQRKGDKRIVVSKTQ